MHNTRSRVAEIIALSCIIAGCAKPASDSAPDTSAAPAAARTTTAAATDHSTDARTIIALDSGWMRQVMAKNVDSLMTYYSPDAVSYGFGSAPSIGIGQVRALYTDMVKSAVTDPKIESNEVKFSDDGSMAFDHGTFAMTTTPPGGKPSRANGAYLNVWKKIDGGWKLVAEMSTPLPAPKK